MKPTSKNWQLLPRLTPEADQALHGYPPILRQILFNRGYSTHEQARNFLEAKPGVNTDPFLLPDMQAAVERILYAIAKRQKIAIYGDYDVDGVTATALLVQVFHSLRVDVIGYIPHRFEEGYGLNTAALDQLKAEGVDLVITVDCGIRSLEEARHARDIGLDLMISDHHNPGAVLPEAIAVIDPKREDSNYPEENLAGVGVAYKLTAALASKINFPTHAQAEDYLDLVALGTVADLVPLIGENRVLVRTGLAQLRQTRRQGIRSLMGIASIQPEKITATDIGFGLGPRLNAAGRLDTAFDALHLLTTQDLLKAGELAQQLEIQNRKRQSITRDIQAQAEILALKDDPEALLLFAAHPDFNAGVVGLAASRLTDQHYRPAIVGHIDGDYTRASCRSIVEFHITQALDQCADLLEKYGGHAAAAGFTVHNKNLAELVRRLKSLAAEQLSEFDLRPTLTADLELPLSALKPEALEYLDWLQPTGYGNPQAAFISRRLQVRSSRRVGKDQSHLKMAVSDGQLTFDAIAFRLGDWADDMPPRIDLLYRFEVNEFRGRKTLQLNVKDIQASEG